MAGHIHYPTIDDGSVTRSTCRHCGKHIVDNGIAWEVAPDRPPMDGNRSDNAFGDLISVDTYLEHGEPDSNLPCMGFYTSAWIDQKLLYNGPYDPDSFGPHNGLRDHAWQDMEDFLSNAYKAQPGYGCTVEVQDIGDQPNDDGQVEVALTCEFWADNGYDGDESLDDWVGRVRANTPFTRVYNRFVIYPYGSEELMEVLKNTKPKESTC